MVVLDPEATAELKKKEALRVPVVCRYYTNAAEEVEATFRERFAATRTNFLNAVEAAYNRRKLGTQALAGPKFLRTVAAFQKQNKGFPVNSNVAAYWVKGESDRVVASSVAAILREHMARPVRPGVLAPEVKLGFTVRLVPLDRTEQLTPELVDARGANVQRSNIVTLSRAREELQRALATEQPALGKFLASLLVVNCVPDPGMTLQARAKRTDPLWSADTYEAGQVIVRRGEVVDRKAKAALDQIREKMAIGTLQQQVNLVETRQIEFRNRWAWLASGIGVISCLVTCLIWMVARRRAAPSLLPAPVPAPRLPIGQGPAELAIGQSAQGGDEVRRHLMPHLARLMMTKLVQTLLFQRKGLLDTQQRAVADLAEFEARLEKIHAPLQDRLRAYEQKICELEKQLARKGQENRQLIQAEIEMVRKQIAATKEHLQHN
jgi:hypothetical protein